MITKATGRKRSIAPSFTKTFEQGQQKAVWRFRGWKQLLLEYKCGLIHWFFNYIVSLEVCITQHIFSPSPFSLSLSLSLSLTRSWPVIKAVILRQIRTVIKICTYSLTRLRADWKMRATQWSVWNFIWTLFRLLFSRWIQR